jgi:hypothetical protein
MSLGGTMFWTLDFDDYTGKFCNEGPFPLANAIKSIFDEYSPQTSPPPVQTTAKKFASNTTSIATSNTSNAKERAGSNSTNIIVYANSSKMGYINIKGNNITFVRNGNLMRNYNSSMLGNLSSPHIYFQNRRSSTANKALDLGQSFDFILSLFFVFRYLSFIY